MSRLEDAAMHAYTVECENERRQIEQEYELAEAENLKYSNAMRLVLVLSSGRIALFNNQRKLHGIYDTWDGVMQAYGDVQCEARREAPAAAINLNLEDLGI